MQRIDPVDRADVPAEHRHLLGTLSDKDGSEGDSQHQLDGSELNVYGTMGVNLPLLDAFREYGSAVWHESGLEPRERELVILTIARTTESAYEWQQHVRVALNEDMSPDEIRAVSTFDLEAFTEPDAVLVEYAAAFADSAVTDTLHDELTAHFDDETIVGITMLAGLYLGLAHIIDALAVDLEREFVGWSLEHL